MIGEKEERIAQIKRRAQVCTTDRHLPFVCPGEWAGGDATASGQTSKVPAGHASLCSTPDSCAEHHALFSVFARWQQRCMSFWRQGRILLTRKLCIVLHSSYHFFRSSLDVNCGVCEAT